MRDLSIGSAKAVIETMTIKNEKIRDRSVITSHRTLFYGGLRSCNKERTGLYQHAR